MGTPTIPSSDPQRDFAAELAQSAQRVRLIEEGHHHVGTVEQRIQASIARIGGYAVPELQDIQTMGK